MALSKKDAFALTICERRASREQARSQSGKKVTASKKEDTRLRTARAGWLYTYLIA